MLLFENLHVLENFDKELLNESVAQQVTKDNLTIVDLSDRIVIQGGFKEIDGEFMLHGKGIKVIELRETEYVVTRANLKKNRMVGVCTREIFELNQNEVVHYSIKDFWTLSDVDQLQETLSNMISLIDKSLYHYDQDIDSYSFRDKCFGEHDNCAYFVNKREEYESKTIIHKKFGCFIQQRGKQDVFEGLLFFKSRRSKERQIGFL